MAKDIEKTIPEQKTGAKTDTSHTVTADDSRTAAQLFNLAKERLQNINAWHTICGAASARFMLTDSNGNEINRKLQQGDHFKINIPAPDNSEGEGYDWVRIEEIDDRSDPVGDSEAYAIRVRPAQNPQKGSEDTAHFFKDTATSSFSVERDGNEVTASVHGRNELPNTEAEGIVDKIRNAVVAVGAMLGLSTPQWKSLVKGLLER